MRAGEAKSDEWGQWAILEQVFCEGCDLDDRGRRALLARVGDRTLATELEALWQQQDHPVFEALPRLVRDMWDRPAREEFPESIGPYTIEAKIGSGGMGTVYKAVQGPPINRIVAVKMLPPELCSPIWRRQFEAEEHLLSLMSHPNLATVYDAGFTDSGAPYLVMEYLEGEPVTAYCRDHRLTISERLSLFSDLCRGVQHAHRKGVIHCDLKPSNILVVVRDERPVVKVIDFGIARAVTGQAPLGMVWGTPAYMSPEQAGGNPEDIDAGSDIYALGVLLYELLVGEVPEKEALARASSFTEKGRVVGEAVDTAAPSRLARNHPKLDELARERRTRPRQLVRALRGELDWITAKSLAHDPRNRYRSCAALTEDIDHYSRNLPIGAAPEHHWYPLRKWFERHVSLASLAAIAGFTGITLLLLALIAFPRIQTASFPLQSHSTRLDRFGEERPDTPTKTTDLAASYRQRPGLEAELHIAVGDFHRIRGAHEEAAARYERASELLRQVVYSEPHTLALLCTLAHGLSHAGKPARAEDICTEGMSSATALYGEKATITLSFTSSFACILGASGHFEEARALFESTLSRQETRLGPTHIHTGQTRRCYADLLLEAGYFEEVVRLARREAACRLGEPDRFDLGLMHNRAVAYRGLGRYPAAASLAEQVLEYRSHWLGPHHPETLATIGELAVTTSVFCSTTSAADLLRETLVDLPTEFAGLAPVLELRHLLGGSLAEAGFLEEAADTLRDTWLQREQLLGPTHIDTLRTRFTMAEVAGARGQRQRATRIANEVYQAATSSSRQQPHLEAIRELRERCRARIDEPR